MPLTQGEPNPWYSQHHIHYPVQVRCDRVQPECSTCRKPTFHATFPLVDRSLAQLSQKVDAFFPQSTGTALTTTTGIARSEPANDGTAEEIATKQVLEFGDMGEHLYGYPAALCLFRASQKLLWTALGRLSQHRPSARCSGNGGRSSLVAAFIGATLRNLSLSRKMCRAAARKGSESDLVTAPGRARLGDFSQQQEELLSSSFLARAPDLGLMQLELSYRYHVGQILISRCDPSEESQLESRKHSVLALQMMRDVFHVPVTAMTPTATVQVENEAATCQLSGMSLAGFEKLVGAANGISV
ncbi:uncharacterized protein BO80DRAFT_464087 [Aspergillus ibericus CBS 121593]|uniref:Uncharacterized protein n=1 Tax=Aspergillus ibericus CBS 121593 TaxID=1448316 RepID=A0A395H507_9EURO|nr:hypothetical protein BO80DRAFT_464087 [Aspergillus ibericus CBS 121593]RAL01978.1 hypothetical protein BO80DRAFT_464087 [Aspergillus ibericus CBS 121593]